MKQIDFKITVLLILLSSAIASCKKLIKVNPPTNQLLTTSVFEDSASAEATLNGLYAQIVSSNSSFLNGAVTIYPGLTSDELVLTSFNDQHEVQFQSNNILPTNSVNYNYLWRSAYSLLYQANSIIENSTISTSLSDNMRNRLTGEAKFLRALIYFYLVNYYGPVPLTTVSDYRVNSLIVRSDTTAVYQQIVADLKDAENLLSADYLSYDKIRANKWSAAALLSRVYLYQKDWTNAELQASSVINSESYSLTSVDEAFIPNNPASIFQLQPSSVQYNNTAEGYYFIPFNSETIPAYLLSNTLLSSFESGDLRMSNWIGANIVNGVTYYYPSKYKVKTISAGLPKTEYNIVLRLAEQYLIRAEAFAHERKINESINDLNVIRARADLPSVTANNADISEDELLQAIYHENQVEFFSEWGHRWLDLKRTGLVNTVLDSLKPGWKPTSVAFPIPQEELLTNPKLIQNPGY